MYMYKSYKHALQTQLTTSIIVLHAFAIADHFHDQQIPFHFHLPDCLVTKMKNHENLVNLQRTYWVTLSWNATMAVQLSAMEQLYRYDSVNTVIVDDVACDCVAYECWMSHWAFLDIWDASLWATTATYCCWHAQRYRRDLV